MIGRKSLSDIIFNSANILFMLFLIVLTLYPFLYVVFASLSDSSELVKHTGVLLYPKGLSFDAYRLVFKNPNIYSGYRNTLIILVFGTLFNLLMTSLGAYVLSRRDLPFKKILMLMIVFTMYFHGGLIPKYLLVYDTLNLGNKLLALIIPKAISTYNMIVMRTSFMGIPGEIEESATVDGANDFTVLFRIILPMSMPVVAVMILFYGIAHWNAWFEAMIYLRNRSLYPLQLIIRDILILNSTDSMATESMDANRVAIGESLKYATIVVATVPVLVIYPFLQKYFVKGVMVGALKG
jgi:putative aldouronate transport system permease protein